MRLRLIGLAALMAVSSGCSNWAPTLVNNGLNQGINIGRTISEDRSLFNVLDDLSIRNTITDALLDEALTLDVSADVYQGMVMLTGAVKDAESRQRAENRARKVDGVRELFNDIQITDALWIARTAKDLLMETALTTRLVVTQGVNSVNYRWRAVNGVVYFMGKANSRKELDQVINMARMAGVRKIVSHVFLTDAVVMDIPEAAPQAKADPEPVKTEVKPEVKPDLKPEPVKVKPDSKPLKKKISQRPQNVPSTNNSSSASLK